MKKTLSFLVCMALCVGAHAASTCLHNRTAVFTLRKSVNGISASSNSADMSWSVKFDYDLVPNNSSYRTITGTSTCNEIDTDTDEAAVKMGAANTHLRASNSDEGPNCWCAMEYPVSSWWVFYKTYADESACKSSCARDCADAIKSNTSDFRSKGVYLAIW